jgi:4-nitrophenyl phosphatase
MDGVLYRGDTALSGVQDIFNILSRRGIPFTLATNNSMASPEQYVTKLTNMGITVDAGSIVTSAMATRDYLLTTIGPNARLFVIGMPALTEQLLRGTNFTVVDPMTERVDALVMGLDREITYEKLLRGHRAVLNGASFIATNADVTLPTELGLVPGCGALVAAMAASTGVAPVVMGKPEAHLLDASTTRMGIPPMDTVMVGDRLDTDIQAGNTAGMLSVLVLTGVSTRDDLGLFRASPDIICDDLPTLLTLLEG